MFWYVSFRKKIEDVEFPNEKKIVDEENVQILNENRDSYNEMPDVDDQNSNENRDSEIKETFYIPMSNQLIGIETNLNDQFKKNVVEEINSGVERAEFRGSGFAFSRVKRLNVEICSYEPLSGSSYIILPKKIQRKNAVVNVQNQGEMCFKWSILSASHPAIKLPQKLYHYVKYRDELNFDGIEFPVRLNRIDKFVKQNISISINVYYYDDKANSVRPLKIKAIN